MIAYKFRAASQIGFAFDILLNQRLYCSSRENLNDPQEGAFVSMYWEAPGRTNSEATREVVHEQSHLRVCSLSMTYNFIPLWAYYASDFSGLAFEVELPDDAPEVRQVCYTNEPSIGLLHFDDPKRGAFESLTMKRKEWEHEREVRIIIDSRSTKTAPYYSLEKPVRRVLVPSRIEGALFRAIRIVLRQTDTPFAMVNLGRSGLELSDAKYDDSTY